MENIEFWKTILERVGFPVFVAVWFMLRTDKKLDRMIELYQEMIDECHRDNKTRKD